MPDVMFNPRHQSRLHGTTTPHLESSDANPPSPTHSVFNATSERHRVMVKYLYSRIRSNMWLADGYDTVSNTGGAPLCQGVLLRQSRGIYVSQPVKPPPNLLAAVQKLNVEIAFTMMTDTTDVIFNMLTPYQTELVLLQDGSQYQIIDSMDDIARSASNKVKKFQYACLVRRERALLVWHDDIELIISHAAEMERKFLTLIWGANVPPLFSASPGSRISAYPSATHSPNPSVVKLPHYPTPAKTGDEDGTTNPDPESQKGAGESLDRPLVLMSSIFVGFAIALLIILLFGLSASELLYESLIDGKWYRMALLASTPFLGLFGLFFVIVIFGNIFESMGPIANVKSNSRFFSAVKPNLVRAYAQGFSAPHITIQMPVYKESLQAVILPTATSLKAAISHYELNGGTANMFINDDGMQYLPEDEAQARRDFYHDNNIGWVARPKHNVDGFVRAGKFKKASNMNHALNISNKTEDVLRALAEAKISKEKRDSIEEHEEDEIYKEALEKVLAEDGKAWASGNIRIGEFILIVDSDTRVPVDCLVYGAAEMFLSPEVAIVQHSAGVMQVSHNYFENGITFFTNLIYSSIRFSIGSGEVAPFVGHNAFLRWEAVQSVARKAEQGGYDMFWSESHVSEDFDITLRLQVEGNVVRLASYHNDGFKEGVSLTVYDELARWEKYAYGCSELVFHPLRLWLFRGPITPLFRSFLSSNMQLSSKITILGYVASYYAIASGLPLTIANYLLIGWFDGELDRFYIESWRVFIGLCVVFNILGNLSLAILRYRLGEKGFIPAIVENFKWMPMFIVFFSGLSFHLNLAILSHLLSVNMEWGATSKEVEQSNFFKEVPKIFSTFRWMFGFVALVIAGMIYLGCFAPLSWRIGKFTAVVPLAFGAGGHLVLPFVLNPALMTFNY